MSDCKPKFERKLPIDCIREIISDVREGAVTVETARRALWAIGCTMELLAPSDEEPSIQPDDEIQVVAESLAADLAPLAGRIRNRIPPEVWQILIQLLLQLISDQESEEE